MPNAQLMSVTRFLRFLRFLRRPGGLAAAVLLAGGAAASAAAPATTAQTWTPIGPNGGSLREIAQAPALPT